MLLIALLGAYAASGECAARNAGNASGHSPMGTAPQSAARIGIPEGRRPARRFQHGAEQTSVFSVFRRQEQTKVSYAMPFSALPASSESPLQTEVAFVAMSASGGSRSADFKTPVASVRIVSRSALAAQVIAEVNAERAQRGLTLLSEDSDLTAAACIRAREIASVFSHTRPDGSSCFTVSEKAYGENIAKGYGTVDKVMAAWMSSEGHRANILRASYGSIGVCCLQIDGVYYWVQFFGK